MTQGCADYANLDTFTEQRRLDEEDLKVQFDAILVSVRSAYFATARAELNGAKMLLDGMERRHMQIVGAT